MKDIAVVLHNVRSVHNVGSIFRTADGAGIKKILLCGITPVPVDRFGRVRPEFAKVALGAEHFVPWEYKRTTALALRALKKEGYFVVAVEQAPRARPYAALRKKKGKFVLVMGNEVEGLPKRILARADEIVEIPMRGGKESLNVSVAFGVVAYGIQY